MVHAIGGNVVTNRNYTMQEIADILGIRIRISTSACRGINHPHQLVRASQIGALLVLK